MSQQRIKLMMWRTTSMRYWNVCLINSLNNKRKFCYEILMSKYEGKTFLNRQMMGNPQLDWPYSGRWAKTLEYTWCSIIQRSRLWYWPLSGCVKIRKTLAVNKQRSYSFHMRGSISRSWCYKDCAQRRNFQEIPIFLSDRDDNNTTSSRFIFYLVRP
jgi:hypothetical protein